ncbi:MAG: hypothetical protein LBU27_01465 [Candidatus Peribacteria bacterium]|jgi:hypothetical protein|nr:hypothetical protein [Candidatus Peribacteria bacterium]
MEDLYNNILQDEQAIDAKRLQKFLQKFKKPELQPSWMFKGLMKKRLHKIIQEHKRQQEASILASIPSFAKWRFGLTGFAVAVCGFLFIFLLSFFTDFF